MVSIWRDPSFVRLLTAVSIVACSGGGPEPRGAEGPTVAPAQPAAVQESDVRELPRTEPWRPDDPVREVGDLRETGYPEARATLDEGVLTISDAAGRSLAALPVHQVWREVGGDCARAAGPPAALTESDDRWLLARMAPAGSRASRVCLAVSRPPDPVTAGWLLYDFALPVAAGSLRITSIDDQVVLSAGTAGESFTLAFPRAELLAGAAVQPRLVLRGARTDPP